MEVITRLKEVLSQSGLPAQVFNGIPYHEKPCLADESLRVIVWLKSEYRQLARAISWLYTAAPGMISAIDAANSLCSESSNLDLTKEQLLEKIGALAKVLEDGGMREK
jgi:hypothetical protein